ncbi:MAG TPA: VWA domain-containing protein [Rhizobiaceae bacterium]|nr:VWA domain-containing protein [Rhizobiaceae bacterium]
MSEKPPVPRKPGAVPTKPRSEAYEVEAFLARARALQGGSGEGGRLILALDATMSRQPTWDLACRLQGEMFDAAGQQPGRLSVQLVYFRGLGECKASRFVTDTGTLKDLMVRIDCRGGHTQIGKVLAHALTETARKKVNAVVFIGDAVEEELDDLAEKAGRLGLHGVPVFVFQEGSDKAVERAFREIARLSKGAWFRFDRDAAATLARLLSAIALFATGGRKALVARGRPEDQLLLENLRGHGT